MNTRLSRKNRTLEDIGYKCGMTGFDGLIDNSIKQAFRINDKEYDFLLENMTDGEMDLFIRDNTTFTNKRALLKMYQNYLQKYEENIKLKTV